MLPAEARDNYNSEYLNWVNMDAKIVTYVPVNPIVEICCSVVEFCKMEIGSQYEPRATFDFSAAINRQ